MSCQCQFSKPGSEIKVLLPAQRVISFLLIMSVFFAHQYAFASSEKVHATLMPADPEFSRQSHLPQIKAPDAWNISWGSTDIVVAVIDSGVDITNPDLKDNIWINQDEIPNNGIDDDRNGYIDDVYGWDFITKTNDPQPKFDPGWTVIGINHGTIVAGVLAARGGNDIGVAGVVWRVSLMPLRVLNGAGIGDTFAVAQAIDYARENGARIINLSFVGSQASETLKLALERAYNAGILVVSASGNELKDGVDLDVTPEYPICSKGPFGQDYIIGVAALDAQSRRASFSNYGSSCIDISAPGVGLFSTLYTNPSLPQFQDPWGGWFSGTSIAVPQIVGVAALMLSINPDLTLSELREIILKTAQNIDNENPQYLGKLGAGLVNAFKAVSQAKTLRWSLEEEIARKTKGVVAVPYSAGGPHVRFFGDSQTSFFAYNQAWRGGLSIAAGMTSRGGDVRLITAPSIAGTPEVRVWDQNGKLLNSFYAYAPNFTGGVSIAIGDLNGDDQYEIITAPAGKGGPHIRVFDWQGNVQKQFFADVGVKGAVGLSVASADLDTDGKEEIILGLGRGLEPKVFVFDQNGKKLKEFLAFARSQKFGVSVSGLSSKQSPDSLSKIITSLGAGGQPEVRIFDTMGRMLNSWLAFGKTFRGGVSVGAVNYDGSGFYDIVVAAGPGGGPHVRVLTSSGAVKAQWFAYDQKFRGGVRAVGVK